MATLRLFAAAREAAGTGRDTIPGGTVGEVLDQARSRYGESFEAVLDTAKVWCNGEPAERGDVVTDSDEVAVLPPVSGGSGPVVSGGSGPVVSGGSGPVVSGGSGPGPHGGGVV